MHDPRRFCLSAAVLFNMAILHGQLVFVPDPNLRAALNAEVPGSVNGAGYLDSQMPALLSLHYLELDIDWTPADLTGLEALSALDSMKVRNWYYNASIDQWMEGGPPNSVTIPAWSGSLERLRLIGFAPVGLPEWPSGLTHLECKSVAGITAFPVLPASLTDVNIKLVSATPAFPAIPGGVERLSLHGTGPQAPPPMPGALLNLNLQSVTGGVPGSWPSGVASMDFRGWNAVTDLPPWPESLEHLGISFMEDLEALPALPAGQTSMTIVDTPIEVLPDLPPMMEWIGLFFLPITGLPSLPPGLQLLDLGNLGQLQCLPVLPLSMTTLYIDVDLLGGPYTAVECLPNFPQGMVYNRAMNIIPYSPSLLCTPLNSTCEFVNPVATGMVYWDANTNGTRDPAETGYPYSTIASQPDGFIHGVGADGVFAAAQGLGTSTLTAMPYNPYVLSVSPTNHQATFSSMTDVVPGLDFGVELQAGIEDLKVQLEAPLARPGFESTGWLVCENQGSTVVDAALALQLDPNVVFLSAVPSPASVVGNTVNWAMPALGVGEQRVIPFTVLTTETTALGTLITHTATLGNLGTDATPADNSATAWTTAVGSYDPNDKTVSPATATGSEAAQGADLTYTVRFQNTGSYQADRVLILDTLDVSLDAQTLRVSAASHAYSWMLLPEGVLRIAFEPIVLPDSASNEPASHGFVRFTVRTVPGLPEGTVVPNSASIIFDSNEPIHTLPCLFSIGTPNVVAENSRGQWTVSPNPVMDVVQLRAANDSRGPIRAMVTDVFGRPLHASNAMAPRADLNVEHLPAGAYVIIVDDNRGRHLTRFVKQ
jgi:uncharacterized repeat protein (TIGR01451 family)